MKTFIQILIYTIISYFILISCASTSQTYYEPTDYQNQTYYGPSNSDPLVKESGKCYAKCLVGETIEEATIQVPIYIGVDDSPFFIEKQEIILSEASTKWVKRKADKNCLSADPNDCMVWCLVEVPREVVELLIVTDTSLTKDYKWQSFSKKNTISKGGFTEWKEVICNYKVTADLNRQIQIALRDRGYNPGPIDNTIGTQTKAALVKFQKTNNLPIGALDVETMTALEIDY